MDIIHILIHKTSFCPRVVYDNSCYVTHSKVSLHVFSTGTISLEVRQTKCSFARKEPVGSQTFSQTYNNFMIILCF